MIDISSSKFIENPYPAYRQLRVLVVSNLLGVPPGDMLQMKSWVQDLLLGFDSPMANEEALKKQAMSMLAMTAYLGDLIDTQRGSNGGLVSQLNQLRCDPGGPTEAEILSLCLLIVLAGYETTVNLLGNGLYTLLSHPQQLTLLRTRPDLMSSAIDEMLRFESPVQRSTFRVARHGFNIAGFRVEKDQQLGAIIGAAHYACNLNTDAGR